MMKIDWDRRHYIGGRINEICRNNDCDWQMPRNKEVGYDELEICPKCGDMTDSEISFGGLIVRYNRAKDNFTIESRNDYGNSVYVDCSDCPDTLLFMVRHYRFDGWSEAVIRETQG